MKKLLLTITVVGICFLTGCGAEKQKVMTCTRTTNQSNLKMDLSYTVIYKGKYVTTIKSEEKVTTDDTATLEAYKTQVEGIYSPYKDIKYYEYNVDIIDNTLISTTNIDYSKIDTAKMIEVDSSSSQLIKDGKVSVDDVESLYTQLGITCNK